MPLGFLFQVAGNAADQIAADLGHLRPGGILVREIETAVGNARIGAVADSKKIGRHVETVLVWAARPFRRKYYRPGISSNELAPP
jgi:hypothetical protein